MAKFILRYCRVGSFSSSPLLRSFSKLHKPQFNFLINRLLSKSAAMSSRSRPRRPTASTDIAIKSVGLLREETSKKHFTSDYETEELVVRRGFPFKLMINLTRALDPFETVSFDLRIGGGPRVSHKSLVHLPRIDPKPDEDLVGHKLLASVGEELIIEVHTSASMMGIGKWRLFMKVQRRRSRKYLNVNEIIFLFNPWSKLDPVYMKNDAWKNEYVLNEEGMQFYGTARRIGSMPWYFGQFEAVVMKACLQLLHTHKLAYRSFSDPILVARHMSALVNSNDDNGVLVGNWSGEYKDGKSPTYWNGSVAILKQFVDSGPVKYGQCWVFSGLLTTVMRCLGIPARSLTNFESAHDTDANLTIDYHFDKNRDSLEKEDNDSIWNFHVWNDVWMARSDLAEGFGGWQALDATPQETSGGRFQCGPVPLHAIKQGQLDCNYDGIFIYAEVNGTKRYWKKDGDGWVAMFSVSDDIGINISTKEVGFDARRDITSEYKYKEGSKEEEISFKHARKFINTTHANIKAIPELVRLYANIPDVVQFGKDIKFQAKIVNLTKVPQKIFLNAVANAVQYNGSMVGKIAGWDFNETIPGSQSKLFTISLPVAKYLPKIKGNDNVKFMFMGGIPDGEQTFVKRDVVDFEKPVIQVEVPSSAKVSKSIKVTVTFTNPLSVALEGGVFKFEGAGIQEGVEIKVKQVKPRAVCSAEVSVTPRKIGLRKIIVGFSSKQLQGVRGSAELSVA